MSYLDEIAGNAAELDANPRFPTEAMEALTRLEIPETRGEEWALVRRVAKADGSVGRIFEGHLNARERLQLDGIDPQHHWLGVWGADPAPGEGEPAHVEGDHLRGTKVFCSGAGGLTGALVIAKGTLVYVDLSTNVEVDKSWYRGGGMRASESHRVHFHGAKIVCEMSPLAREPYFSGDAIRTAAAWAGILDSAIQAALPRFKDDDLSALAAGRIVTAQATIDRWFEYAAQHEPTKATATQLREAIRTAGATILDEAASAAGSRPFATGTALDRARRDFELFVLQHRLDPLVARMGHEKIKDSARVV